ncbi:MAG TPA: class I SAM-dependent methyltransferase [Patescibacteria group bacterium]|nr:class I SAM-dependent methyltransferase [Patescibacteria group bacterium]
MKTVRCAICQESEKIELLYPENLNIKNIDKKIFSARRIPDKIHYKIVKCKKCGLIFSREIFPLNKIISLYKKSDIYYKKESEYLAKTYYNYFKKHINPKVNIRVLDVGAGDGFFLNELFKNGITDVWGVEPGSPMVKKSSKNLKGRIKADILKPGLFKKSYFDVIVCFHTLDHIVDPNQFIKIVYSLLKPGGKIFFVVHNTDGLSVKLFGEKSPIFDVEHIYLFNPKTLSKIFKKNGFKKTNVFSHYNTYPISYWLQLVPIQKKTKLSLMGFLKKNKIFDLPLRINPGNIGIVAQK